jgi:hypothetical protein
MAQVIKRAVLASIDTTTYTCSILLLEATSTYLNNVPLSKCFNANNAQSGDFCAVLFFDENNQSDAVVVAVYTNGTLPTNPGQTTFVTGFNQFSATAINSGVTSTFTVTGGSTGIPTGVSGVLYKIQFSSPTAGAFLQIAPHGATIGNYNGAGNIQVASSFYYGDGIVQVDANGQIDIKANVGNCTVWLYTYGYIS